MHLAAASAAKVPQLLRLCALAVLCFCCTSVGRADATAHVAGAYRQPNYVTYGEWNPWGFCTSQCLQYRRRSCTSINQYLWPCSNVFQRQSCNTDNCILKPLVESNLSALDCGRRRELPASPVLRIFGGSESQPHSWPWHVSLVRSNRQVQFCGGTLIHPQFVLTARHCVVGGRRYYARHVFAILGDHDTRGRQPNEQMLRVVKIRTHPGTRASNLEFDVALLKLEKPATLSDHVRLACLPRPSDPVAAAPVNTMCTAIGFGRQGRGADHPLSPTLREVNLYLTDHAKCHFEYLSTNVLINQHSHVCAAAVARDTCSGDSGGGLFCADQPEAPGSGGGGLERWYLFGITSFGHPRGCGYHSGVFQRASILYEWVQSSIIADLRDGRRAWR